LIPKESGQKQYFILSDNQEATLGPRYVIPKSLLVREATSNAFIESYRIIFGQDASSRGFYQFAQWVEPPPKRVTFLLIERLEREGLFESVSRMGKTVLGDLQLNLEVLEFYHDISSTPGQVKVRFKVELIDANNRSLIAKGDFKTSVDVQEFSARGAVSAFSKAVNPLLGEIVVWLAKNAA
jgi:cholesterol transport system auxiliary component